MADTTLEKLLVSPLKSYSRHGKQVVPSLCYRLRYTMYVYILRMLRVSRININ